MPRLAPVTMAIRSWSVRLSDINGPTRQNYTSATSAVIAGSIPRSIRARCGCPDVAGQEHARKGTESGNDTDVEHGVLPELERVQPYEGIRIREEPGLPL